MNIEIPRIIIEINHSEMIDLYYALRKSIECSIEEHWKNFTYDIFESGECQKLYMLKEFGRIINIPPFEMVEFKRMMENKKSDNTNLKKED